MLSMKERYPDPLYWGAFVCQGDPGPLTWKDAGIDQEVQAGIEAAPTGC